MEEQGTERQNISDNEIGELCFQAYTLAAQRRGLQVADMTNKGICREVTQYLYSAIKKKYPRLEMKVMHHRVMGVLAHEFIEIQCDGVWWILDATWQQFLGRKGPARELPSVLWVRKDQLKDKLVNFGLSSQVEQAPWMDARQTIRHLKEYDIGENQ
jgi:hypothetical protein